MTLTTFTAYGITRFPPGKEAFAILHTDGKYWAVVIEPVRPTAPDNEPPAAGIETVDQAGPFNTYDEAQAAVDAFAGRTPPP